MIYLYGLIELREGALAMPEGLTRLPGVTGPVSVTDCAGLGLIHGAHDGAEILPRRRLLLAHAKVLEASMGAGAVLPMRFGMTSSSTDEVARLIGRSRDAIRAAFARVRGHVELGVRVTAAEDDALRAALSASPELAAAHARLAAGRAGDHFAKVDFGRALGELVGRRRQLAQKQLLAALKGHAASHVLKAPETDFEVLRAEFLVPETGLQTFSDALEDTVAALGFTAEGDCTAQIIGPGPAFHFVNISLASDPAEAAA